MAFNGSGVFSRLYNWVADAANGIKIRADRMDAELDGIATGLSNCILRDGTGKPSADIDFNSKKITALAAGTASTDAINKGQLDGVTKNLPRFELTGTMNSVSSTTPDKIFKSGTVSVAFPAGTTDGYNSTTGEITVHSSWGAGWYDFTGYVGFSASAGGAQHTVRALVNGSIYREVALIKNNTTTGAPIYEEHTPFSIPIYLAVGDKVAFETTMSVATVDDGVIGLWLHYRKEQ